MCWQWKYGKFRVSIHVCAHFRSAFLFIFMFQLWFTRFMANCSFCLRLKWLIRLPQIHLFIGFTINSWSNASFAWTLMVNAFPHNNRTYRRFPFGFNSDNLGNKRWAWDWIWASAHRISHWISSEVQVLLSGFQFEERKTDANVMICIQ